MEAAVSQTDREDVAEKASEFLLGVLERMGISADIDIKDDTDRTVLEIQTQDTELVIGRRGVVIDALQHLVNKAVFKEKRDEKTKPLVVDSGGFRDKQVERLRSLAQRMSEKALQTKQVVELQPIGGEDVVHQEPVDRGEQFLVRHHAGLRVGLAHAISIARTSGQDGDEY